jgi:hypothetical protein
VKHLKVLCTDCDVTAYHVLKDTDTLKVIITNSLGTGKNGFEIFPSKLLVAIGIGISDMEAAEQYLEQQSPVSPEIEKRIQLENEDKVEPGSSVIFWVSLCLLLFIFLIGFVYLLYYFLCINCIKNISSSFGQAQYSTVQYTVGTR